MFRKLQLVTVVVFALSAFASTNSVDAHGRGGGGLRLGGGGLVQRARQSGNSHGYRGASNPPVVRSVTPVPQTVVSPPVVQSKPPVVAAASTKPKPAETAVAKAPNPAVQPQTPVSVPSAPAPAAETPAAVIAPVEVASPEPVLPQIPVGATVTLNGKDLTDKAGQVMLQIGDIAVPATIKEWKNDAVICTLPLLGLTKASKATLHVLKADGKTASTMNLELVTSLPTLADNKPSSSESLNFDR